MRVETKKMRTPLIAGNWKMNTTLLEGMTLIGQMRLALDGIRNVEKLVCPPFISLASIGSILTGSTVSLGAQNMFFEEKGAFTGEISPLMLAGLCQYVILGHSERRHIFGESDELIARKLQAALKVHLKPILCVGERLVDRENGRTQDVIWRQLQSALAGLNGYGGLVIAYEPVWAIGIGRAATSEQANETIFFIRCKIAELCGTPVGENMRLLYGGSVTCSNIAELMSQPEIDGALVGGASLKAIDFISLVEQTAKIKGEC
jgi:triosephosphate isomerase (TIM)